MKDEIQKKTHDVQERIRELAYMMWESAGRQQGMATDYWLAAEREVLKTMQRAAEAFMPGKGKREAPKTEAPKTEAAPKPEARAAPKPQATAESPAPAEAKPKPAAAAPEPAAAAPKAAAEAAVPERPASTGEGPSSIEDIEGIGPTFAKKLKAAGITTPAELLDKCGKPKQRKAVVETTGIPMKRVLRWVNMADLMRIEGVDADCAELLEASGVDTVKELATRRADNLSAKMAEVNASKRLARTVPDEKAVAGLISKAKSMEPKVSF